MNMGMKTRKQIEKRLDWLQSPKGKSVMQAWQLAERVKELKWVLGERN